MRPHDAASADADVLGGERVFTGTRVPVRSLFDHLEGGDSIDDFLTGFPSFRRDQVIAVLEASRAVLPYPCIMIPDEDFLFVVATPLGFTVRVTRRYWQLITTVKHPVMAGHEAEVQATLSDPEEIRRSRTDENVLLFYRTQRAGRWVCAVTRRQDDTGFLITAYPTDAIKERTHLWPT